MNAPILRRSCPLQSNKIAGDAPRFFCDVCRKDVVNLSLLSQDQIERLIASSKNGEVCALWLAGSKKQLVLGEKSRASFRKLVTGGILAASLSGSLVQAGSQLDGKGTMSENKAADIREDSKECGAKVEKDEVIELFVGLVEFEVAKNTLESQSVEKDSAKKNRPNRINFHKRR